MSDIKQVKVDNWGVYFLQRLKHFFNRTDYCDLTLQFQDNAQLKVHRLVLSACTEYFELLERTCEMYEDCLVMPDDLQADVVVPIINFMYTGQLEFKVDLLERLYQTSLVMNMPVLTKLLGSHREQVQQERTTSNNYYGKRYVKNSKMAPSSSSSTIKRPFSSAFGNSELAKAKKSNTPISTSKTEINSQDSGTSNTKFPVITEKNKHFVKESRPMRYELPEELDEDNIFDNSFTNISYTSKPLMVHPETTKQYRSKKINLFDEGSSTSRFIHGSSSDDVVECKKITVNDSMFLDEPADMINSENDMFPQSPPHKEESKDSSQLFDQIMENEISNITIETKQSKLSGNLDHAKIISEVLKKYPHLVKSNKHIKLKILNTGTNKTKRVRTNVNDGKEAKVKAEGPDFTYESDVIDSKQAARLIAMGPDNVKGPWICLICGTPGKALHFTSYFNFRKHLVEVHNEKPSPNICEYCGLKSQKRNYLVYHQLTKHDVVPPSHYNFPKCNYCKYVALNEALLVKHKLSHVELRNFKRNISTGSYTPTASMDSMLKSKKQTLRKGNECIYCLKVFLRESNLYAHLKIHHKQLAKNDGLIEDSDEEIMEEEKVSFKSNQNEISDFIKVEVPPSTYDDMYEENNIQYQIERRQDGNIHLIPKKQVAMPVAKHKILNPGFTTQHQTLPSIQRHQQKKVSTTPHKKNEFIQEISISTPNNNIGNEDIVVIDNNEYIVRDFQLFPKKEKMTEYLIPENKEENIIPTTSMEFHNNYNQNHDTKMFIKKSSGLNEPLQIVVSNEEEYKALLNSNQSVIFDDGVSSETLAVLTAPNTSNLQTRSIDLDNTQSNEMMIIPEDFPINVSQTIATNNSNIVVVYSHPVEDQSKQYQLITAQNVGEEFVQSSAILTQNYETVTTPCVSAHTTVTSWPTHIQTSISKLPKSSIGEMQEMPVSESVTVQPETVSSNINEFPESLATTVSESIQLDTEHIIVGTQAQSINGNFNESNIGTDIQQNICRNSIIQLEQTAVNNDHQITVNNLNQQSLVDHIHQESVRCEIESFPQNIEQTIAVSNIIEAPVTLVTQNLDETRLNNVVPVIVEAPPMSKNQIDDNDIVSGTIIETIAVEGNTNSEIFAMDTSEPDLSEKNISQVTDVVSEVQVTEDIESTVQSHNEIEVPETVENIASNTGADPNTLDHHSTTEDSRLTSDTIESTPLKVASPQIANLTSEWSEDESEVLGNIENNDDSQNIEINNEEVEESIENIQQEVDKHTHTVETADTDYANSQPNIASLPEQQGTSETPSTSGSSKEKISSLLNDWDDNDSQEEVVTTTPSKAVPNDTATDKKNDVEDINKNDVEDINKNDEEDLNKNDVEDINKNDKIKSLVSDWDEEDDKD